MQLWYYFRRKTKSKFKPVILITGCSSGIGLALAELLYSLPDYRVVATARAESLPDLQRRFQENDSFILRPLDVNNPTQRTQLIEQVTELWEGVNILINNAGISYRAVVEHMSDEDELHQMAINYLGPVSLIRQVMPHMRKLGRGKIINVSSVAGMLAMPTLASYSASKHALEGLSEALWYEAKPLGINVSLIQPGFVRSKSFERVYYTKLSDPALGYDRTYGDYYKNMTPFIAGLMNRSLSNPEAIARLILKVIRTENPPLWIPATLDAVVFYYVRRLIPRRFLLPVLFLFLPKSRSWGAGYSHRRKDRS